MMIDLNNSELRDILISLEVRRDQLQKIYYNVPSEFKKRRSLLNSMIGDIIKLNKKIYNTLNKGGFV